MCKQAELYGDYVQVDGTFCMCYDGKVLLALVVVDGLNRSVPAGFALIESENSSVSFTICIISFVYPCASVLFFIDFV